MNLLPSFHYNSVRYSRSLLDALFFISLYVHVRFVDLSWIVERIRIARIGLGVSYVVFLGEVV